MKRIFVTGNAGSGKTTVAIKLSQILSIDYFGLDKIVWKPGWVATAPIERAKNIAQLTKLDSWIIDGVSTDVFYAADTVIFLDFSKSVSYWRVLKRTGRYLFKSRPELPSNCPEILIVNRLIKIIWDFPSKVRPSILAALDYNQKEKNIIHIHSNSELNSFLAMLENNCVAG